jgi:hypothetical protein
MDLNTWLASEKGRAAALAKHFGRSPGAISQWRFNGVPVDLMKGVREFTGGEVTLEEMVPDMASPAQSFTRSDGTVTSDERHPEHDPAFVKRKLATEGPCALDPGTPLAMPRRRSGEAGIDRPRAD